MVFVWCSFLRRLRGRGNGGWLCRARHVSSPSLPGNLKEQQIVVIGPSPTSHRLGFLTLVASSVVRLVIDPSFSSCICSVLTGSDCIICLFRTSPKETSLFTRLGIGSSPGFGGNGKFELGKFRLEPVPPSILQAVLSPS